MSQTTESSDCASFASDRPLVNSQDLAELMPSQDESIKPTPTIKSQPKTCSIERYDSKEVHTSVWKGSQVVNYKRFKKYCNSPTDSPLGSPVIVIGLRRVDNEFRTKLSHRETIDDTNGDTKMSSTDSEFVISNLNQHVILMILIHRPSKDGMKRRLGSEDNEEETALKKARNGSPT